MTTNVHNIIHTHSTCACATTSMCTCSLLVVNKPAIYMYIHVHIYVFGTRFCLGLGSKFSTTKPSMGFKLNGGLVSENGVHISASHIRHGDVMLIVIAML